MHNEIQNAFKLAFNNQPNMMTPNVRRYEYAGQHMVELSTGTGLDGQNIYGVTVLTNKKKNHTLSNMFHSIEEAETYIESLRTKQTDRDRVNAAIEHNAMSTMVTVSLEHVEEMRDCLPPVYMGHKYPFNYIQVGEAASCRKNRRTGEYEDVYETYCTVSEEGKSSPLAARYDFGQWYFIGLKPAIKD